MNKSIDALKPVLTLALEALEQYEKAGLSTFKTIDAIVSLRETLAHAPTEREQPAPAPEVREQQEPVAWEDEQGNVRMTLDAGEIQSSVGYVYSVHGERIKNACIRSDIPNGTPLYTSPPIEATPLANANAGKPWVGLTDAEWMNIVNKDHAWFGQRPEDVAHEVAKLVEAKLKEKNQ